MGRDINGIVGSLQIHGKAGIVPYGSEEYMRGRAIYDGRFPQYKDLFELEDNELYRIKPYVIWQYNPGKGEMHRDEYIINEAYYRLIEVYKPHTYLKRSTGEK